MPSLCALTMNLSSTLAVHRTMVHQLSHSGWVAVMILNMWSSIGLREKVALEYRLERGKEVNHVGIWENILSRGKSQGQGP